MKSEKKGVGVPLMAMMLSICCLPASFGRRIVGYLGYHKRAPVVRIDADPYFHDWTSIPTKALVDWQGSRFLAIAGNRARDLGVIDHYFTQERTVIKLCVRLVTDRHDEVAVA